MRNDHPPPYAVIAAIAAALALLALWRLFVRLRRERLLADTPEVRIRSAAQGYVKVSGLAAPAGQAPLAAPLSARRCVWWSYQIARQERDARGNERWNTVDSGASVELFLLSDALKVLQRAGIAFGPACRCPSHDVPPIAYQRGYQRQARGGPDGPGRASEQRIKPHRSRNVTLTLTSS